MMFNRSKAWALALLAAVFVAGAGAGWTLQAWADGRRGAGVAHRPRGPDAMVDYLARRLELSDTQRDSVRAVLGRHRSEMEAVWRRVHPTFDSLRTRINAEISAQLTPDQQARFQELLATMDHRHRLGDSAKQRAGGQN